MRGTVLALMAVLAGPAALAAPLYDPPEGCTAIATLRLPSCLVRQVASCPNGNIVDAFHEGVYTGRSFYGHPSLFLRYEGVDGYVSGHEYGPEAPGPGFVLQPDTRHVYSRDVYRGQGEARPGDTGQEIMAVGQRLGIELAGRRYQVLDIRFEVSNPKDGYLYRERALMIENPGFTLGVVGTHYKPDGTVQSSYSSIPESISLEGEPGFRSQEVPSSCLPMS